MKVLVTNYRMLSAQNSRPVANAGGDQSLVLPLNYLILNGSNSHDDLEITNWTWTREGESLAAGKILEGMDGPVVKVYIFFCIYLSLTKYVLFQ